MKKLIERASVVFKEVDNDKYECFKSRDGQLTVGGKYSEDFVRFYRQTNEDVVVLDSGEITTNTFKDAETIEFKGAKYQLVSRKAQPGDVFVPTENTNSYFTNGKPYGPVFGDLSVLDNVGDELFVYNDDFNRTESNIKVYEPVDQSESTYRLIAKEAAQVGDFVKYAEDWEDITAGKMYEIINVDEDGDYEFKDDANDVNYADMEEDLFEVYTLREKEAEPKPAPLQVGDYAKVVAKHTESYGASIGEIVKIVGESSAYNGFRTEGMSGNNWGGNPNCSALCLVKATDAEVAKAKTELVERAEAERWAKIGRKPNEFKKGDIVRVVNCMGTIYLNIGQVTEIINPQTIGSQDVRSNDGNTRFAKVELITPVEARFEK